MVKKLAVCFVLFLLIVPTASLAEDVSLDYEGNCKEFNVTVVVQDFKDGLYDVKIGVTSDSEGRSAGRIYDPTKGWKSSYYYVEEILEVTNGRGRADLKVQTETSENITVLAKVRKDGTTWESGRQEINQICPEKERELPVFLLIVLTSVMVVLIGVTYYHKSSKGRTDD